MADSADAGNNNAGARTMADSADAGNNNAGARTMADSADAGNNAGARTMADTQSDRAEDAGGGLNYDPPRRHDDRADAGNNNAGARTMADTQSDRADAGNNNAGAGAAGLTCPREQEAVKTLILLSRGAACVMTGLESQGTTTTDPISIKNRDDRALAESVSKWPCVYVYEASSRVANPPTAHEGVWEALVSKKFVEEFVRGLPTFSTNDNLPTDDQIKRRAFFRLVYGDDLTDMQADRLSIIEFAFDQLSRTQVQDPRSSSVGQVQGQGGAAGDAKFILQPAYMKRDTLCGVVLQDETLLTGVDLFLRPGRTFYVNDVLAFNLIIREMQAIHPLYNVKDVSSVKITSRGTMPTSETLQRIGVGPPAAAVSHRARKYRGPRDTDPNKICPLHGTKQLDNVRDLMYYRVYESTNERAQKQKNRHMRGLDSTAKPAKYLKVGNKQRQR